MRTLIVVVALILAIGGIWLAAAGEANAPPEALPGSGLQPDDSGEDLVAGREAQGVPTEERSAITPNTPTELGEGPVLYNVRVVRGEAQDPVPGAIVRWIDPDFDYAALPKQEQLVRRSDQDGFLERRGEETTTDSEGRLALRGPAMGLTLHAWDGSWYGRGSIRAFDYSIGEPVEPDPEYIVEIHLDQTLVVRTVDRDGEPVAGVPVRLTRVVMLDGEPETTGFILPESDSEGLVRRVHAQELVASAEEALPGSVAAQVIGGRGESVAVDLFDVPDEPIDVVVPDFGSLEVVLLGPDGRPWQTSGTKMDAVVLPEARANSGGYNGTDMFELSANGRVVVSPVLCGEKFQVQLQRDTRMIEGPLAAGETVRVEFRMASDLVFLAGRIVDTNRQPVSGSFRFTLNDNVSGGEVATDGTGRFSLPLTARMVGTTPRVRARETEDLTLNLVAMRAATEPLQNGVNELGDLVLEQAPVLVQGRMEYTDGTPVSYPVFDLEYLPEGSSTRWGPHYNVFPDYPGDGTFTVHAHPRGPRYRVRFDRSDYTPADPIEFLPGAEDLVIRVSKGGQVQVTALGDTGAMLRQLQFVLVPDVPRPTSDTASQSRAEQRQIGFASVRGSRATCTWTGLTQGNYRLTISCPGTPPIVTVDDIEVRGGELAEDPRLVDVDLKTRILRFAVTVIDATGNPLRGTRNHAVLIRREDGSGAEWEGRALDKSDGRAELFAPHPVDLIVIAPGHRTLELSGVFADTTVQLSPSPEVRLRLAPPLLTLPADTTMQLRVARERPAGYRSPQTRIAHSSGSSGGSVDYLLGMQSQNLPPADNGDFILDARGGSVVNLSLRLRLRTEDRSRNWTVQVIPATIDLDSISTDRVIELQLDPESLKKAMDEIGS